MIAAARAIKQPRAQRRAPNGEQFVVRRAVTVTDEDLHAIADFAESMYLLGLNLSRENAHTGEISHAGHAPH